MEHVKKDFHKIYETIWTNMERENDLINYRIQWAIALSGAILVVQTVLATFFSYFKLVRDNEFLLPAFAFLLMSLLARFAGNFCRDVLEGVNAALSQIDYLKGQYESKKFVFNEALGLPRPFGDPQAHDRGHTTARAFPSALVRIWAWSFRIEIFIAFVLFGISITSGEFANFGIPGFCLAIRKTYGFLFSHS